MIQLICRWMCPESLHVYRRMGSAEHEAYIKRASLCDVDLIQAVNIPTVSGDQHMSQLSAWVSSSDSRSLERVYEEAVRAVVDPLRSGVADQPATAHVETAAAVQAVARPARKRARQ